MESFKSIPIDAEHDEVFDNNHIGEMTEILRDILDGIVG